MDTRDEGGGGLNSRPLNDTIAQTGAGIPDDAESPEMRDQTPQDGQPQDGQPSERPEQPLSDTLKGAPDAGGLAGQGGMRGEDG